MFLLSWRNLRDLCDWLGRSSLGSAHDLEVETQSCMKSPHTLLRATDTISCLQIAFLGLLYPCVILCYLGKLRIPASYPRTAFARNGEWLSIPCTPPYLRGGGGGGGPQQNPDAHHPAEQMKVLVCTNEHQPLYHNALLHD